MSRFLRLILVTRLEIGLVGLFIFALPSAAARDTSPDTGAVVDTLDNALNSDGDCSLREAITAANDNHPVDACPSADAVLADTITFSVARTKTLSEQPSVTAGTQAQCGEWEWQNPLPQGNSLYGVWGSSGSDVFAVGDAGTILHYDGAAWSAMSSGTTTSLLGV